MTRSMRDAVAGEVVDGSGEERGAGGGLLVVEDLGVGEAAVVIDDGVDVVEPDPGLLLRRGRCPSARPWARQPPPSGIRPIFLTSMWTSSPGRSRS